MRRVLDHPITRKLRRGGRALVLLLAWFAALSLAGALIAGGYGPMGLVVAFAFVRAFAHVVIPSRWSERCTGGRWIAVWAGIDALTLLGAGILVIGGGMVGLAALTSPFLASGVPGLLCIVAGVHAGAILTNSTARWRAGSQVSVPRN